MEDTLLAMVRHGQTGWEEAIRNLILEVLSQNQSDLKRRRVKAMQNLKLGWAMEGNGRKEKEKKRKGSVDRLGM